MRLVAFRKRLITEKLRGRDTEGCEELLAKVEEQYNNTVDAIHMMED